VSCRMTSAGTRSSQLINKGRGLDDRWGEKPLRKIQRDGGSTSKQPQNQKKVNQGGTRRPRKIEYQKPASWGALINPKRGDGALSQPKLGFEYISSGGRQE